MKGNKTMTKFEKSAVIHTMKDDEPPVWEDDTVLISCD